MKKMKLLATALCAGVLAIASLGLAGCTDNSKEYLEAFEQSDLVTQYSFDEELFDPTPFALTECEVDMTEQDGNEMAAITATLQNENLKVDMQVLGTKNEFDEYNFTLLGDPVVTPTTGVTYVYYHNGNTKYKISDTDALTETFDPETNTSVVTANNYVIHQNTFATETLNGTAIYEWNEYGWSKVEFDIKPTLSLNNETFEGTYVGEDGTTITVSNADIESDTVDITSNLTLDHTVLRETTTYDFLPGDISSIWPLWKDEDGVDGIHLSRETGNHQVEYDDGMKADSEAALEVTEVDGEIQANADIKLSLGSLLNFSKGEFSGPVTKQ